jgi:hypothetical protein
MAGAPSTRRPRPRPRTGARRCGRDQSSSSSSPPARRITIWSSSIVTSTGRWLGVHGVVLDGGIEPQAVALLAVVERPLERPGGLLASTAACAGARAARRLGRGLLFLLGCRLLLGGLARCLLGGTGLLLGAALLLGLELGGDRGVVLGAQVDLVGGGVGGAVAVGLQAVLALERLDLLHRHLELVGDPGVGPTLSHPPSDLVKLRTQRPAAHQQAGRLAKAFGCEPHGARDAMAVRSTVRSSLGQSVRGTRAPMRTEWQGGRSCSY